MINNLKEEIIRKELVIKSKDEKCSRLISIIREKNNEIRCLEEKLLKYEYNISKMEENIDDCRGISKNVNEYSKNKKLLRVMNKMLIDIFNKREGYFKCGDIEDLKYVIDSYYSRYLDKGRCLKIYNNNEELLIDYSNNCINWFESEYGMNFNMRFEYNNEESWDSIDFGALIDIVLEEMRGMNLI